MKRRLLAGIATVLLATGVWGADGDTVELRVPTQGAGQFNVSFKAPLYTEGRLTTEIVIDIDLYGYPADSGVITIDPTTQVDMTVDGVGPSVDFTEVAGTYYAQWANPQSIYNAELTLNQTGFQVILKPTNITNSWGGERTIVISVGGSDPNHLSANYQLDAHVKVEDNGSGADALTLPAVTSLGTVNGAGDAIVLRSFNLQLAGDVSDVTVEQPVANGEFSEDAGLGVPVTSDASVTGANFTLAAGFTTPGGSQQAPANWAGKIGFYEDLPSPTFSDAADSAGTVEVEPSLTVVTANDAMTLDYHVWAADPISHATSGHVLRSAPMKITYTVRDPYLMALAVSPANAEVSGPVGQMQSATFRIWNAGGGSITDLDLVQPLFTHGQDSGYARAHVTDPAVPGSDLTEDIALTWREEADRHNLVVEYVPTNSAAALSPTDIVVGLDHSYSAGNGAGQSDAQDVTVTASAVGPPAGPDFDIALVLDRSGSMSGNTHCVAGGGGFVPKMDALHAAGRLFYQIVEGMYRSTDSSGIVQYNQSAVAHLDHQNLSSQFIDTALDEPEVTGSIRSLSPSGSTSISRGIGMAVDWLDGSTAANRSILVMTDGMHNNPSSNFANDLTAELGSTDVSGIRVFSVGLGDSGNLTSSDLEFMATGGYGFSADGGYRHSCSTNTLGIYFAQVLANAVLDLQIIKDDPAVVTTGETYHAPVPVNSSASRAVFYVTWADPRVDVSFHVVPPEGVDDPGNTARFPSDTEPGYAYYFMYDIASVAQKYDLPPFGDWVLEIEATPADGVTGAVPETVEIEYACLILDRAVHAAFDADDDVHAVGEPITLTATVTEGGSPARNTSVRMLAQVPGVGLGDFIFGNEIDPSVTVSLDGDDPDATVQLATLLEQIPEGLQYVPLELELYDDGTHGDAVAHDGVHTRQIAPTGLAAETEENGVYSFRFIASGTDLTGAPFERTSVVSTYLTSFPEPAESQADYYYSSGNTAFVHLLARDLFGNQLDPVPGRSYKVESINPRVLEVRTVDVSQIADGTIILKLEAMNGRFTPMTDPWDLLTITPILPPALMQAKTVGPPLHVERFHWRLALEMTGYWLSLPDAVGVDSAPGIGARLRVLPSVWITPEVEIGMTQALSGDDRILQYGANLPVNLPLASGPLRPYAAAGIGGLTAISDTTDTYLQISLGAGFRWYPDYRMNGGLTVEVRDDLLFNEGGFSNAVQIFVGAHAHLF